VRYSPRPRENSVYADSGDQQDLLIIGGRGMVEVYSLATGYYLVSLAVDDQDRHCHFFYLLQV
jgi:hypothetical protein